MTLGMFVGALLLIGLLYWVMRPFWQGADWQRAAPHSDEDLQLEQLLFQRESVLQGLRDLEMDHQAGKLNDEDFAALEAQLRAEGVAVLKALDEFGASASLDPRSDDEIEQWIERAVAATLNRHRPSEARPTASHEQPRGASA